MRPALEVADIFRRHGEVFRTAQGSRLSSGQRRVMAAIETCRTAALGGHVERCEGCGMIRIAYCSCRDRHCPKCQGLARAQWLADRKADLLPVPYFHLVFTVPATVAAIALQNKAVVYGVLLKSAADTVRVIGADPRYLGAEIALIAILHTWGQTLTHHPHAHCIVPGGGLAPDGSWRPCRPGFFLPVHVLSRLYRRLFLDALQAAFDAGKLHFFGDLAPLADPACFTRHVQPLRKLPWVVYVKPPLPGPEAVLDYLGRYTHRVAIANSRLLACENGRVSFRWKDYRDGNKSKVMTLDADEFIRRFLLHVLPKGFRRIRHFGFLANACRVTKLRQIRAALHAPEPTPAPQPANYRERCAILTGYRLDLCPHCGGHMIDVGLWSRPWSHPQTTSPWDTS
jgi:hypothetical protein